MAIKMTSKQESTKRSYSSSLLPELHQLKKDFKDLRKGYRASLYTILQRAMVVTLALQSDKTAAATFLNIVKKQQAKSSISREKLTALVVAYVTNAKSDSALKLAWKRARVLDHLYDEGISTDDIAVEIKKRGGIEKLAKAAASETPRRVKPNGTASTVSRPPRFPQATGPTDRDLCETDNLKPAIGDTETGDSIAISVRIEQMLLQELQLIEKGAKVELTGIKVLDIDENWDEMIVEIIDVRQLVE